MNQKNKENSDSVTRFKRAGRPLQSGPAWEIAEDIRKKLQKNLRIPIPTTREWAQSYGVSPPTMGKALHILRREGLLQFGRGKRLQRSGENVPAKRNKVSTYEKLAAEFEERIKRGSLRTGEYLPKLQSIARTEKVSNTTVQKALSRLQSNNRIHKSGKNWIIGPEVQSHPEIRLHDPDRQVIVLIQEDVRTVMAVANSERTKNFYTSLESEAIRHNVGFARAYMDVSHPHTHSPYRGKKGVAKLIRSLGNRYLGSLILTRTMSEQKIMEIESLITRFQKPVVTFDAINNLKQPSRFKNLFRCIFSEKSAVDLAVRILAQQGHKHILYVAPEEDTGGWRMRRYQLVRETASNLGVEVTLGRFDPGSTNRLQELLKPTAWLVCRDSTANRCLGMLLKKQIRIPRDLSVLSFDNRTNVTVSSIDFGFDYLGYAAFHLLYGVLPVQKSRKREVYTKPFYIDKGTASNPHIK